MKKLILSAAILLGSLSTFAQTSVPAKTAVTTQATAVTTQTAVPEKTAVTTQTTAVTTQSTVPGTYTEITVEEVPEAVKSALTKTYSTAILNKAFINEKKEYELQVKVGDRVGSLYADATGAWIKK
jgi:hypothetical protein